MTIEIVKVTGLCTIQDLGRRGHMHEAVPPGGALVPELLVAANRAVHNPDDAPALELSGQLVVKGSALLATDRGRVLAGTLVVSEPRRVTYVAVRGGLDVPRVLDGYGTLLCAGLGRPLRAGDAIAIGTRAQAATAGAPFRDVETIEIVAGPDLDAFAPDAFALLQRAAYRIEPTSNRVGTRLSGTALPRIPAYRERSRPMVIGAIEVPRDGKPIVLGPEHPTTGGYPVIGVIATEHLGAFFATRLGGRIRFRTA